MTGRSLLTKWIYQLLVIECPEHSKSGLFECLGDVSLLFRDMNPEVLFLRNTAK